MKILVKILDEVALIAPKFLKADEIILQDVLGS